MSSEEAVFGAGCFWSVEETFSNLEGVLATKVGYGGGDWKDPTYEEVCSGETEHAELVKLEFDPDRISYDKLLDCFFELHDPTTLNRQGLDIGSQYRSVIFYMNSEQRDSAEKKIQDLNESGKFEREIVTSVEEFRNFYPAEEYHQHYIQRKNSY